jgi:hypothetical protein
MFHECRDALEAKFRVHGVNLRQLHNGGDASGAWCESWRNGPEASGEGWFGVYRAI